MDDQPKRPRLVGDYLIGPKIGSGSFAVVWRAKHRYRGTEVAVKEIDKTQLSRKVSENLFKEISILSTINHPNIIRLFETITTKDKIYLVLEYCDCGDLGAYVNRHGKVPEATAKLFIRELAAGLKLLHEKHLIHRDLKPQNLLLSSNEMALQLKIGDFGFARSLTPQDLADTLCGSPLYMAPEIIQNHKYDAKADLWSVGAILFQLVTGEPPFSGNSQLELFQNILKSSELKFPKGSLEELHSDCVDLCRSLLRRNPVERLTFDEFFNHNFLGEPRLTMNVDQTPDCSASASRQQFRSVDSMALCGNVNASSSPKVRKPKGLPGQERRSPTSTGVHELNSNVACNRIMRSVDYGQSSSNKPRAFDSMEFIEKEYVLVNADLASLETSSYYLGTFVQDSCAARVSILPWTENKDESVATQRNVLTGSINGLNDLKIHDSHSQLASCCASTVLREIQDLSVLHPSTRLHLLRHYVQALEDVAQEKYDAGFLLESFSLELVVLAVWKRALEICRSWQSLESTCSKNAAFVVRDNSIKNTGSKICSSFSVWAEQGFVVAFDRAEKLSSHLQKMDASLKMPDAMETIFQKALTIGTNGAIDEYMENTTTAVASYSKAMLLLSFLLGEAATLPLNPPFSLTAADKKRIESYIGSLQSHQSFYI